MGAIQGSRMAHGSLRAIDWATALRWDVSRIQRDPANVAPRHRVFAVQELLSKKIDQAMVQWLREGSQDDPDALR